VSGDFRKGAPENKPYSIIFINGSVAEVPKNLLDQLAPDGRLVAIVKKDGEVMGEVTVYEAAENGHISSYTYFKAGCVYLKGFEPKVKFEF
jgi:protein-L-isoaspartate(D-aspartate) O-methyltransferase